MLKWDWDFLHCLILNVKFQALSVFILYVRCTAIDPSDPGILLDADKTSRHKSQFDGELPGRFLKLMEFIDMILQFNRSLLNIRFKLEFITMGESVYINSSEKFFTCII